MTPDNDKRLAQALLHPASVALYGASDDVDKMGGRPVQFLKRTGFAGRIYPINPRRDEIQGLKAWPSLQSLPEVPDQVFVLTPTETVIPAVRECAALGVKVVTILASGFSESGAEGAAREGELRRIAKETGIRILGPSSLGVVNPRTGLVLTANAAFAEPDLPPGKVFVASHSGSMIGALVSRGKARGVGFAGLVSVGSEVDLNVGEICAATLDDPAIEGYLLFLESLRHGPELRAFARAAHARGKPVIAYKLGRSAAAAEMATTHTGAIAGEDDIAEAFLKDMGVARVGVLEALLETFPLARRIPLESAPKRVGVVTTTGGGAAMAVEQLGIRGVVVEPPSADTLKRLEQAGLPCTPGRVLDMTLAGTKYETMKATLDILLTAPEFDLVLAVVGSSARFQPQLAVKPIVECAGGPKPLAAMLVPDAPEALAALTAAGVPCFRTPEACGDAIAAVLARRRPGPEPVLPAPGPARTLSEAEAYGVLHELGVPHAPVALRCFGEAPAPLPFAYPVVAKVCSAEIPHKTEVGGVLLNIGSDEELAAALATLRRNLDERAPKAACDEVLVQPMQKGLSEVLVGYRVDPDAGPIVMLAAGGIWAEVAKDRSIRLAPVTVETAREMVAEVNALKPLTGLRGKARGDLEALARTVSALSQLALKPELGIAEAEVNPLLVLPEGQGVVAVDALVFQWTPA
ncbi:acetate--CoA ligase family protein [Alicycliphilus denitrificans]|uniref:CoA-binding domain protein n=1 Tax=Alicycliphilus denitrificans (strain DSM 14773 / CIP 107495 / K601) TaxID=596154 RepID=F4GEE5_ALIDK|nr:acetate--CoA ligase family protein [Alicycliphilus denitrificans]AEB82660.1 CoA-binding domain protein [Alicycliphilus denitrificans K601]